MILGRFQPITDGHMKVVQSLYEKNQLPTVWCLVTNKKIDNTHPFSDDLIKKEIDGFISSDSELYAGHIYVTNADIVKCAEKLHDAGFEPILWGCGSDRYPAYKKQADKYKEKAGLLDEFDCLEVKRNEEDISATKVRQAISDDDFARYSKLMPIGADKDMDLFEEFKKALKNLTKTHESLESFIENDKYIVD